ncbi:molybdate ABC transporter substrate-binding protein [Aliiroseovarius zhejiangensis]|uniref:Molybdate ABC transporter substrate-binding protein n=2 Tax=Aliiroseovarius zhejiangensis TaxID=1632025 RepID=A0ABQ3INY2_9RHOB|nr:molybdate ABC transporter substrate-binding protein [Aliiroseovarius zhejiangensis]
MYIRRALSVAHILLHRSGLLAVWLGCAVAMALLFTSTVARADEITVFAAASLKDALDKAVQGFEAETGNTVHLSYAGSSVLARQISQGAPADVFISANTDWMDVLETDGHIAAETRVDLVGNDLVLIAPANAAAPTPVELTDLAGYLAGRRLAMGLVEAVPAGIYGKAALQSLGQWDSVAALVAQTDNVRAALALVALGQTPLGIVYGSDALADARVQVVMRFPADSHPAIRYPAAVIAGKGRDTAHAFLNWLQQDMAIEVFLNYGFTALEGT